MCWCTRTNENEKRNGYKVKYETNYERNPPLAHKNIIITIFDYLFFTRFKPFSNNIYTISLYPGREENQDNLHPYAVTTQEFNTLSICTVAAHSTEAEIDRNKKFGDVDVDVDGDGE